MASACISESNLGLQTVVSLHQKDPEGEKLGSVWPAGSSLKLILASTGSSLKDASDTSNRNL